MRDQKMMKLKQLINEQIELLDWTYGYFSKLRALINILLNADIPNYAEPIIHDYLWAMNDILNLAEKTNGKGIDNLVKIKAIGNDICT